MTFFELEPICFDIQHCLDNIKAISMALTASGTTNMPPTALYISVDSLDNAYNRLTKAVYKGIEQEAAKA